MYTSLQCTAQNKILFMPKPRPSTLVQSKFTQVSNNQEVSVYFVLVDFMRTLEVIESYYNQDVR